MRTQIADSYGGRQAKAGDVVYARGTVLQVDAENVLVEFFSKTDQWSGWIRPDLLEVDLPELPAEPADHTMLWSDADDSGTSYIFYRNDAEGHNDRDTRRHDRHWWSFTEQQWVDWPHVVARGGHLGRRLVVAHQQPEPTTRSEPESEQSEPVSLSPQSRQIVIDVLKHSPRRRTTGIVLRMVRSRGVSEPAEKITEYLAWLEQTGQVTRDKLYAGAADRWTWVTK